MWLMAVWFDSRTRNGTIEVMSVAIINETGTKMIDCREAARRYGCTMRYIRRLAADGRLSYEVAGGTYLLSASDIEQLKRGAAAATGREKKRAEGFQPG
jgi:excisionase family DNA binding protein